MAQAPVVVQTTLYLSSYKSSQLYNWLYVSQTSCLILNFTL